MKFSKMHGAGNDFSLFNGFNQKLPEYSSLAKAVCDRHFGVGGDGIMIALPSENADVRMVYYNSNGSMGEMCGNGIRCFSKFVYEKGIVQKPEFTVETAAGIKTLRLTVNSENLVERISAFIGKPAFNSADVPTTLTGNPVLRQPLEVSGETLLVSAINLGVPHCVVIADDLDKLDFQRFGSQIQKHPAFPQKVNANFMEIVDRGTIKVKTYERGAYHTLACGTGCCSCAVVGRLLGLLDEKVTARAEGGEVVVYLSPDYEVLMEGTAQFICDGEYSPWILERISNL